MDRETLVSKCEPAFQQAVKLVRQGLLDRVHLDARLSSSPRDEFGRPRSGDRSSVYFNYDDELRGIELSRQRRGYNP